MQIEWWQWMILGFVLLLAELFLPTFFVLWFGVGAIFTGVITLVFHIPNSAQILVCIGLSLFSVWGWFKLFKHDRLKTRVGTAEGDVIGEVGLLSHAVGPFQRGKVRFQRPILGAEEWVCSSDVPVAVGARVRVVSIEGSFLKIEQIL